MDLLEEDSSKDSTTSLEDESHECKLCNEDLKQPRVLSCLHVYCEPCLDKLLTGDDADSEIAPFDSDDTSLTPTSPSTDENGVVKCPECEQITEVTRKSASSLLPDYVMCNQLDMTAIENMKIICTSCKAKEKAVARCSDCSNFLCPNCVSAHHYMRCFENHKVVTFEEMKSNSDGTTLHKPITCPQHTGELMKFFCHPCQRPICNECIVSDHCQPEHHYERISDIEEKQREEIKKLMSQGKTKLDFCEEASNDLHTTLLNLQMQRDNARSHVEECIQSYKAIVEKCGDCLLKELDDLHLKHELGIMETIHNIEKTSEKIEDACKFVGKLVENGNGVEILSLKQLIGTQLRNLINNIPKPENEVGIEFVTNPTKVEETIKKCFGSFKKEENPKVEEQTSPLPTSIDTDVFALPSGVISPDSLPSSNNNIDLELSKLTSSAMAEYNLHQLAGLVQAQEQQRITSPHSSGHSSQPSPAAAVHADVHAAAMSLHDMISSSGVATPTDSSAHMNAVNNLTVLAKLGSFSVGNNGQILLNGQVLPGLTRDCVSPSLTPTSLGSMRSSGPTPPLSSHTSGSQNIHCLQPSPIDSVSPNSLGALLNGTTPRSMSPHPDGQMINGGLQSGMSGQMNGPAPRSATTKLSSMQIRCKFGQLGPGKGQFNSPHGFCLGLDEDIIVADTNNHRIQVFDKIGEFKYQFGIPGKEEGQLWYPRKVAVMRSSGKFVVCDRGNERSRMQIFTKNGHFIKKIAIRYIDIVAGLAINSSGHIVAVDSVSPTVFVIGESGDLLRWFDCSDYMREPSDIAISGKEFYVCDFKGHCVVVFSEEGQFSRRIGCENITNFPNGIDISDAGDVLVGDSHGNRFHVAVFSRVGSLLSEFECPYVKVSRCCGLKITSEGYVVTLAKNNHHVLVLNTLYIA